MPPRTRQQQGEDQDQAEAAAKAAERRKRESGQHKPGEFRVYRSYDGAAPGGGRDRDQLVLVTGVNPDSGHVYGKPLGWADEGAQFEPGQLRPVGSDPDDDGDGAGDGGG
jgi:hypothetical protein